MSSFLEIQMEQHIRGLGLTPVEKEFKFHPKRKWRFDFAWPKLMIALEVEGGTHSGGRHVRGNGFDNDCEKYNEAAILGWTVLRVTSNMIKSGMAADQLETLIIKRIGRTNNEKDLSNR